MNILLLLLSVTCFASVEEEDLIKTYYPDKKLFFRSCMKDETFYKCDILWSNKSRGCESGVSFGSAVKTGVGIGVGHSIVKGLLR